MPKDEVPMAAVTAWVMKDGIGHLVAIAAGTGTVEVVRGLGLGGLGV